MTTLQAFHKRKKSNRDNSEQTPDFSNFCVYDGSLLFTNYNPRTREATIVGRAIKPATTTTTMVEKEDPFSNLPISNGSLIYRDYDPKTRIVELVTRKIPTPTTD